MPPRARGNVAELEPQEKERYRKASTRMWVDERVCALSKPQPNATSLWHFFVIGPCTSPIPGFVVGGPGTFAEWLDWPVEGVLSAFAEIANQGMAVADWRSRLVWLPKAINHNEPESPNVVRGWRKTWPHIPECNLKWDGYRGLLNYCDSRGRAFREAFQEVNQPFGKVAPLPFGKVPPLPSPNQEQEQEQEQEKSLAAESASPNPQPEKTEAPRSGQQRLALPAESPREQKHTNSAIGGSSARRAAKNGDDGSSEHRQFVDWWATRFEALFGSKYGFDGGKDGRIVKELLARAGSLDALKRRAEALLTSDDPWYLDKGRDLGLLRTQWNKLASAKPGAPRGRNGQPAVDYPTLKRTEKP